MILDHPILYPCRGGLLVRRHLLPAGWRPGECRPRFTLNDDDRQLIRSVLPEFLVTRTDRRRFNALPDYAKIEPGTAVVWGEAGAAGVTLTMTVDALASGSARMGAVADLGAQYDPEHAVILAVESGTAPTAGGTIDLYMPSTHSTSYYPGGVTGSDGAWPSDGNEDEWALQLGLPVSLLKATNDGNVVQVQGGVIYTAPARYNVAVLDNNWSQAIRDEATATNNDTRIIMVPRRWLVQDTA